MPCYIRLMGKPDVSQVAEIDREAFPDQWPMANYQHELENQLAYYIVACDSGQVVEGSGVKASPGRGLSGLASRMRQWFSYERFFGEEPYPSGREYVLGFAGFWVIAGEAHLTNVAVRESHRRQGIGELLLMTVIELARDLNASFVTLEVRASNNLAQNLYRKYGFSQTGIRRGYYINNREDGILMSTENIASASFQAKLQQLKQGYASKWGPAVSQVVS